MDQTLQDDLTHDSGREDGISGTLVPDENGYRRAIFTETTLDTVPKVYAAQIASILKDYKEKVDPVRAANLAAFEGESDKGEAITIPIVKRDANQQLAWLLNTLESKDPFITVRPLEAGHIQIVVKAEDGTMSLEMATTEEEADALELLTNFYLDDIIGFQKILRTFVAELLRDGARPPLLKICHEEKEREQVSMNVVLGPDGKTIQRVERNPVREKVADGHPTRIELVPGDKFFIPLGEYDIQRAPLVFQEFEESNETIKDKIARGVYDGCKEGGFTQDDIDLIFSGLGSKEEMASRATPTDPKKTHKLLEVWHDFPFASVTEEEPDPETGEVAATITVELVPFCTVIHWPSKLWLNCYENFYWHQRRPFFAGRMQERPFSFSGYSTAENSGPHQRLITQLFQLQLQNLAVTNVKTFAVRRDSHADKFLRKTKLRPGLIIPVDDINDIKSDPLGGSIAGVANEIAFLNTEAERMNVVNDTDRGQLTARTTVGAYNASQNLAKQQQIMVLNGIRGTLADAVKCFVQTLIQFSPEGIVIPFKDDKTSALVSRIISFPRELIVDQFAFEITATGDDETPEALMQRDMMLDEKRSKFAMEAQQWMAQAWMPGTPPPIMNFGTKIILGARKGMARLYTHARLNADDFLPTEQEIQSIPIQLMQMQMMMQQQQIGGASDAGVQDAGPGGAVPGPGGNVGGMVPMEGQPGDIEGAGNNPAGGL